jgi:hypothetical protein
MRPCIPIARAASSYLPLLLLFVVAVIWISFAGNDELGHDRALETDLSLGSSPAALARSSGRASRREQQGRLDARIDLRCERMPRLLSRVRRRT